MTVEGEEVTASFFAPFDRTVEPYIRIATGDYPDLLHEWGRDDALAAYLVSLSHEVLHYQQWVDGKPLLEDGIDAQARDLVNRYALTVDHP